MCKMQELVYCQNCEHLLGTHEVAQQSKDNLINAPIRIPMVHFVSVSGPSGRQGWWIG